MRPHEFTAEIDSLAAGDPGAADRLLPLVYAELRALAAAIFAGERNAGAGHTLQPTALVHEAYARLAGAASGSTPARTRDHFMALAAQVMRRVLVDHARAKFAGKRDAARRASFALDSTPAPDALDSPELLDLDDAISQLAALYPRPAQVVEMRFFGGMTNPEIARFLGVADATIERDWALARGWLHRRLAADPAAPAPDARRH